jgi:hypothetical protein
MTWTNICTDGSIALRFFTICVNMIVEYNTEWNSTAIKLVQNGKIENAAGSVSLSQFYTVLESASYRPGLVVKQI